jgi:hypothetical protein
MPPFASATDGVDCHGLHQEAEVMHVLMTVNTAFSAVAETWRVPTFLVTMPAAIQACQGRQIVAVASHIRR